MRGMPVDERASTEADGATLGEAKWNAIKALEQRFPGIDADEVDFTVLDEGGQGAPARVRAEVDPDRREAAPRALPDAPAERVREVVTRVTLALGLRASVDIEETDEEIRATVNGEELGSLIGRHGATIDAIQHIAARAAFPGGARDKTVVVDAAGYRERREAALHRAADRAVSDALSYGRPVELEPMAAQERRIVHLYLRDRTDVETHSEGDEPDRRLVVTPVRPQARS
jgi:spoIIIJ-associated protein